MIGMVISPAIIILLTFFFWWSSLVGPLALGLALHLQETISKNLSFWYSFLVGLLRGFTGNIYTIGGGKWRCELKRAPYSHLAN